MITDIFKFNREILGISSKPNGVCYLPRGERQWLIGALSEEVQEFVDSPSVAEDIDALIDLCYFAIGGLARLGITEEQAKACFKVIHDANMTKKIGVKETRPNDGSVADAVKDETFKDPKFLINEILNG